MIEIRNDDTIVLSRGDTFDMIFVAGGEIELPAEPEKIKLEIKYDIRREPVISGICAKIEDDPEGKALYFNVPEVQNLVPGAYWYDLVAADGLSRRTLCWPKRLLIAEIAHSL